MSHLETEVDCSDCKGEGNIVVDVFVGYSYGEMSSTDCRPIFKTSREQCPKCNGRGVIDWVKNVIGI